MADFDVSIGADFSQAIAQFKDVKNLSAKQFSTLQKNIAKELRKAEKSTARFKKAVNKNVKDPLGKGLTNSLTSAKEIAEGFGGSIGGAAGMLDKFAKAGMAASSAVGPVGVAIAGATIAIGLLTVGAGLAASKLLAATEASHKWAQENKSLVPPETVAALDELHRTTEALSRSLQVTSTILLGDVASGLESTAVLALKLSIVMESAALTAHDAWATIPSVLGESGVAARSLINIFGGSVVGAFTEASEAVRAWNVALGGLDEAVAGRIQAQQVEAEVLERVRAGTEKVAEAVKDQAEAERDAAKASAEAAKAAANRAAVAQKAAAAQATANKALRTSGADLLTVEEKLIAAADDRDRALVELQKSGADIGAAFLASEERLQRDLTAARKEASDEAIKLEGVRVAESVKLAESQVADLERIGEAIESAIRERMQAIGDSILAAGAMASQLMGDVAGLISGFADLAIEKQQSIVDAANQSIEANRELLAESKAAQEENDALAVASLSQGQQIAAERMAQSRMVNQTLTADEKKRIQEQIALDKKQRKTARKAQRKALKKAFIAEKAAALVQVTIEGAKLFAGLATFFAATGPGAPIAAAAIATPLTAGQLALVAAQKAPKFAAGGLVGSRGQDADHMMISASPDEGILKPSAVAALGGEEGLDKINAGAPIAPQSAQLFLDSQLIAEGIAASPAAMKIILRAVGQGGLQGAF